MPQHMTLTQMVVSTNPRRMTARMQLLAVAAVTIAAVIGIIVVAITGQPVPEALPLIALGGMTYLGGFAHGTRIGEEKDARNRLNSGR